MNFDDALAAHMNWKVKLRTAIGEKAQLDAATISRDDACVLGKWLHGEARTKYGKLPTYHQCMTAHAAFHREAGKIAKLINENKLPEAEAALGAGKPYSSASHTAVLAIQLLKKDATPSTSAA